MTIKVKTVIKALRVVPDDSRVVNISYYYIHPTFYSLQIPAKPHSSGRLF